MKTKKEKLSNPTCNFKTGKLKKEKNEIQTQVFKLKHTIKN